MIGARAAPRELRYEWCGRDEQDPLRSIRFRGAFELCCRHIGNLDGVGLELAPESRSTWIQCELRRGEPANDAKRRLRELFGGTHALDDE